MLVRIITVENTLIRIFMRRARLLLISVGLVVVLGLPATGYTGGWSIIDRRVHQDESGIWNPNVYRGLMGALSVAELGGALWEGSESRLGKTLWQTMDSQLLAVSSATAMKFAFTRERPSNTSNPNEWFAHDSNESFPSGEAAWAASLVTPFVFEYASEHPSAYGLLLIPLYVGAGRIRGGSHWQSDVLAGWAVGGLSGWYAHRRETPIFVEVLPHGAVVGLKTHF
jgi:undecaprenyl-diphosphatase